jgi:hypothetical protein
MLRYRVLFPIKRLDNKTRFPLVLTRYVVFDTPPSPRRLRPLKPPFIKTMQIYGNIYL